MTDLKTILNVCGEIICIFYSIVTEMRKKDEEKKEEEDPLSRLFFLSFCFLFKF